MKLKTKKFNISGEGSIDYDRNTDSLDVRINDKNTSNSINLHDILIIHLTEMNKLAGFEIMNISRNFGFNKKELLSIDNITFKISIEKITKEVFISSSMKFETKPNFEKELVIQPVKVPQLFSVVA